MADSSPAESFWDKFQVVVGGHEFGEAGQFADAWWDPVKVQLVGVDVQLLQLGQLTDSRLDCETRADVTGHKRMSGNPGAGYARLPLQAAR